MCWLAFLYKKKIENKNQIFIEIINASFFLYKNDLFYYLKQCHKNTNIFLKI